MSTDYIYGDPPNIVSTEKSSLGYDHVPFVGRAWEETLLESLPGKFYSIHKICLFRTRILMSITCAE